VLLGGLLLLPVLAGLIFRVGVFVVQPIGAVPDGVTIVYVGRGEKLNFIDSADGVCLRAQDGVNLLCRVAVLGGFMKEYENAIIVRLPYSKWAYRRSTGGQEFDG